MNRRAFLKSLAAVIISPILPSIPLRETASLRGLTKTTVIIDEAPWYPPKGVCNKPEAIPSRYIPCDGRVISKDQYPHLYNSLFSDRT